MKQIFYRILSVFFIVLGVIGIFLPVMPTVPFLLAALYFAADAPAIRRFIRRNPLLKQYLTGFQKPGRGTPLFRYASLVGVWFSLGISFFLINIWWCRWLLLAIGCALSWYFLKSKR